MIIPLPSRVSYQTEYIRRNLEDAAALKRGELRGEKHPYLPCRSYKGKWTAFYYDK